MSEIRKCFTSRFPNGNLFEIDFNQLEVAALAFLSQDANLISDIRNDLDMHLVSLSWVIGQPYETLKMLYDEGNPRVIAQRKAAKRPRFELQYGAGPHTIAKNNNWPLDKAKAYIEKYYERYPNVKSWQNHVASIVEHNAKTVTGWTGGGSPERISHYMCPHTHRRYVFKTYPNKRGVHSFSPTQMKNYPVQGFATADLVPTVLGELVNVIYEEGLEDDIVLINTIHDSVLLDVATGTDMLPVYRVFNRVVDIMKNRFNITINVPIRWSVETGKNWGEIKPLATSI